MRKMIIISGAAATGKTTLAKFLSEKLKLPYYSKDQIKELLFDSLGWSDKEWSKKLGAASVSLLYSISESEMSAERTFILESNFKDKIDTVQIDRLIHKYGYQVLEFHCHANLDILMLRFKQRVDANQRHPGHIDHIFSESYFDPEVYKPMTTAAVQVETSDFSKVDYKIILEQAEKFLR